MNVFFLQGLTPVLPIFREGILNGSPDMKEQAAKGLSECIQIMTPLALKPSVVNITGICFKTLLIVAIVFIE